MKYFVTFAVVGAILSILLGSKNLIFNNEMEYSGSPSMRAIEFKYTLVIGMTLAIQMIIDIVVDNLSNLSGLMKEQMPFSIAILLSMLVPNIIIFFAAIPSNNFHLMHTISQIRTILIVCTTFVYIYEYGNAFFRGLTTRASGALLVFGLAFQSVRTFDENDYAVHTLDTVGKVLEGVGSIMLIGVCIKWGHYVQEVSKKSKISSDHYRGGIFLLALVVEICASQIVSLSFGYPSPELMSVAYLLSHTWVSYIFIIAISMLQTRLNRREMAFIKDALQSKKMFVRYISHEVRTPLNIIKMGLEVLRDELSSSRKYMQLVNDISVSCDIAVEVLNEMLTFDKLEAGILMLERTIFNAMDFLKEAVSPFQIQAIRSGITLTVSNVGGPEDRFRDIVIYADRNKLSHVVRNLVSNGLKFTPPKGTVKVEVSLADDLSSPSLLISVKDTGVGISLENQSKLFRQIIQFNPGKLQQGGGSGLGLYISHGIMDLHGGKLSVYSTGEGHGCTFTAELRLFQNTDIPDEFTLTERSANYSPNVSSKVSPSRPATDTREEDCSSISEDSKLDEFDNRRPSKKYSVPNGSYPIDFTVSYLKDQSGNDNKFSSVSNIMNVLVADDAGISRKMQCRLLEKRGVVCFEAEDGAEAVAKVQRIIEDSENGFCFLSLILMDSHMPNMDGLTATRAIRSMGYNGIIVGVTGDVMPEDVELFMHAGADAVLAKPLEVAELDRVLKITRASSSSIENRQLFRKILMDRA